MTITTGAVIEAIKGFLQAYVPNDEIETAVDYYLDEQALFEIVKDSRSEDDESGEPIDEIDPDEFDDIAEAVCNVVESWELGDEVSYHEFVYTGEEREYFFENAYQCEEALENLGSDLGEFNSISDAISAAVHAHLAEECASELSSFQYDVERNLGAYLKDQLIRYDLTNVI